MATSTITKSPAADIAGLTSDVSSLSTNLANISGRLGNNSFANFSLSTTETTITLSNGYRGMMMLFGASSDACGLYMVWASSSGTVNYEAINSSTITINTATSNKLKVKTNSGTMSMALLTNNGTVS